MKRPHKTGAARKADRLPELVRGTAHSAANKMVRMAGLEPALPEGKGILSPVRLPVSPHPRAEFPTGGGGRKPLAQPMVGVNHLEKAAPHLRHGGRSHVQPLAQFLAGLEVRHALGVHVH